MFIKLIVSILFIGLSFLIYFVDKRKPLINALIFIVLGIIVIAVYSLYDGLLLTKTALVFALIYSMSLIVLIFIMRGTTYILSYRYQKLENSRFIENYKKILGFLKREAIILLITIYQMLIIWNPSILGAINI